MAKIIAEIVIYGIKKQQSIDIIGVVLRTEARVSAKARPHP